MQYFECSVKNATQNYGCSEILKKTSWSFFLLEPRGTGKSWWTKKTFADALRVDLLDAATLRELAARPERLRDMVHGAGGGCNTVLVDEVQKLPELLEIVHGLIEEKSGKVFVLTGSSARKLRRAGVNFLGGRAGRLSYAPVYGSGVGRGLFFGGSIDAWFAAGCRWSI